ncbi:hypothetical protein F0562_025473 [Nyssa sinensis]|uniref:Uncharacterized protein n=1 Tax=Nyssa sinensis TaxID=561372 RepID=A0A5J5BC26_9ASTE|nr:hypothetical protein F0562_025473 [Nyssa sinensis]
MASIHPLSAVSNDLQVANTATSALPAKAPSPSIQTSGYTGAANHAKDLSGLQQDSDHSVKVTALPIDSSPNVEVTQWSSLDAGQNANVSNCSLYAFDVGERGPNFLVNEKEASSLQQGLDPTAIAKAQLILFSSNVEATKQAPLGQIANESNYSFQRADASKIVV